MTTSLKKIENILHSLTGESSEDVGSSHVNESMALANMSQQDCGCIC